MSYLFTYSKTDAKTSCLRTPFSTASSNIVILVNVKMSHSKMTSANTYRETFMKLVWQIMTSTLFAMLCRRDLVTILCIGKEPSQFCEMSGQQIVYVLFVYGSEYLVRRFVNTVS